MAVKNRKTMLNPEEIEGFLERIANNQALSIVCAYYTISPYSVEKQFEIDAFFLKKYETAKRIASRVEVDSLIHILDNYECPQDVAAAKIKSDNIRWRASKHARDLYGEKIEVSSLINLDISKVLDAARSRVAPMLHHDRNAIDVIPMKSIESDNKPTGLEPVTSIPKAESFDDLL